MDRDDRAYIERLELDIAQREAAMREPVPRSQGRELTIGPLGSRRAMLHIEQIVGGVLVETGCFKGMLEAFREQVMKVHGNDYFGSEYLIALTFINNWLALPADEQPGAPTGIEPARRL